MENGVNSTDWADKVVGDVPDGLNNGLNAESMLELQTIKNLQQLKI